MLLTRYQLEHYDPNKRSVKDRRKRCAWAVFSYLARDGTEFRKAFTAPPNTPEEWFLGLAPETIKIDLKVS